MSEIADLTESSQGAEAGIVRNQRVGGFGDTAKILWLVDEFSHSFSQHVFSEYLICARLDARGPNSAKSDTGPSCHGDSDQQLGRRPNSSLISNPRASLPCFRMTSKRALPFRAHYSSSLPSRTVR